MPDKPRKTRDTRLHAELPICLWGRNAHGEPFLEVADTLNISEGGVCVKGVISSLSEGDIVGVRYHQEEGRFQVVWKRKLDGSDEWRVGMRGLDGERQPWTLELWSGMAPETCRQLLREALASPIPQHNRPEHSPSPALAVVSDRTLPLDEFGHNSPRVEKCLKRFLETVHLSDDEWEKEMEKVLSEDRTEE